MKNYQIVFLFYFGLISVTTETLLKRRKLNEVNSETAMNEIIDIPNPELKRELLVRPSSININLKEVAFKDTILNLDSSSDIRIKIHVKNKKFLPFFN